MGHPAPASTARSEYKTFLDFCTALRAELVARLGDDALDDVLIRKLADPEHAEFVARALPTSTALWNGLISLLLAGGVPVERFKNLPFGEAPSPAVLADYVIGEVVHATRLPADEIMRSAAPHKPRIQRFVQATFDQLVQECIEFAALEFHNRPTAEQERTGDEMPEIAFGTFEEAVRRLTLVMRSISCQGHRRILGSSFARVPKEHRACARGVWILLDAKLAEDTDHEAAQALADLVARNYGAPKA